MQEEPFTKFSLPKINVHCLHKIVTHSTVTLLNLIEKEQDERFVKNFKIFTPNRLHGYPSSSFLSHRHFNNVIESSWENLDKKAEMLPIDKETKINSAYVNEELVDGKPNEAAFLKREATIASDFGWESEDESFNLINKINKQNEVFEARAYPSRLLIEKETSPSWHTKDFQCMKFDSVVTPSLNDVENENDVKCDFLYSSLETEETFADEHSNLNKSKVIEENTCESLNGDTVVKPVRCYEKKTSKNNHEIFESKANKVEHCNFEKKEFFTSPLSKIISSDTENPKVNAERETGDDIIVITPKKTKDITKIKGWRRKQFLVEKPTTVEFYSYDKTSAKKKIRLTEFKNEAEVMEVDKDCGDVENAFVCDSLNKFLDNEAELKINYEIPHLYAEVGIKLTSEDLVSRPNLTEEDFKEVGNRYCVELLHLKNELTNLENVNCLGKNKKYGESDRECKLNSYKLIKSEKIKRKKFEFNEKLELRQNKIQKAVSILKTPQQRLQLSKVKEEKDFEKLNVNQIARKTTAASGSSLTSKLIGLVVYPDGVKPLHPVVQKHLFKLRSYRTKIDGNWADFAASAIRDMKSKDQYSCRKILPVHFTGKMVEKSTSHSIIVPEVKDVVKFLVDSICEEKGGSASSRLSQDQSKTSIKRVNNSVSNKLLKLKECRVVVKKISVKDNFKIWCMEHECYNCYICGYIHYGDKNFIRDSGVQMSNFPQTTTNRKRKYSEDLNSNIRDLATDLCVVEIGEDSEDENSNICPEPSKEILSLTNSMTQPLPTFFNQRLTNLLTKKLRDVAFNDDILINIDRLRSLVPDGLELIKLNFVKQSFLTGYINLWYLKPTSDVLRSRAFLTFSKIPPESNAINIDRNQIISTQLPKVITEIVSSDKVFDNDEYAILHCNGKMWEIHGSLNVGVSESEIAPDKSDLEVEQIVIPVPLTEMDEVRKAALHILRVKATKWWVLDLSQKFSEVVLNISAQCITVSRKHLLSVIKSRFLGFLVIKKRKGRLYGIYILENMFPFVLIGPYYIFEKCSVTIKLDSKTIPFTYKAVENLANNCSLKFYINSVINAMDANKSLVGLWLYDKKNLENACYLETLTTNIIGSFPKSDYSVETEHGYALNSLMYNSWTSSPDRTPSKPMSLDIPVYLYFDIFELGYITGELQTDNSIVISHPLSPTVRIKSHQIGNLFIRLLKKRIQFIPSNFKIKWFVTKHKEDLRNRLPFNKLILGGAHILCQHGLLSMMKLTNNKIKDLGLKRRDVLNAMSGSKVVREVTALKNLKVLVNKNSTKNLSMEQVLLMGVKLIEELKSKESELIKIKMDAEETKLALWKKYVALVNERGGSVDDQIRHLFNVVRRKHKKREVDEKVQEILQHYDFGKKFIEELGIERTNECETNDVVSTNLVVENDDKEKPKAEVKKLTNDCKKNDRRLRSRVEINSSKVKLKTPDKALVKRLEGKLFRVCESLDKSGKSLNVPEYKQLIKKLNAISNQINVIKNIIKDESKKPFKTSFKTRKKYSEDLQKIRKMKTRKKPPIMPGPDGENAEDKDRENQNPKESQNNKFGFVKLDPAMFSGKCGNDARKMMNAKVDHKENEISVVKVIKNNSEEFSESFNGKMLQESEKQINGNKFLSSPDKKFIIIKRGKNRVWSIRKLNGIQGINVLEGESAKN